MGNTAITNKVGRLEILYSKREKLENQLNKLKETLSSINIQIEKEEAREIKNILSANNYSIADLKELLTGAQNSPNDNVEGAYNAAENKSNF